MPSVIWAEQQRLPAGFLEQIIEYRRYAEAVAANDLDPKGWTGAPMRTLAMQIEHALAAEEIARG